MQHHLSPPTSLRALRVRPLVHGYNMDENNTRTFSTVSEHSARNDLGSNLSRGRTRSRPNRSNLALNTKIYTPHNLSLTLPSYGSKLGSQTDNRSSNLDDDLIFQMSPVLPQSPHSVFLSSFEEEEEQHMDSYKVEKPTLSTLWESHTSHPSHPPHASHHRIRKNTITQHHRGFSDSIASTVTQNEKLSDHRTRPSSRTVLDLSSCGRAPLSSASHPSEPFMYTFPVFESSPLAKARQARTLREAGKSVLHGDRPVSGHDFTRNVDASRNAVDPSGEEPLCNDDDDVNYISRAFQSVSLEPEKEDFLVDERVEDLGEEDDDYYSSQRSSSVSSESTDDESFVQNSVPYETLHAPFPVRASTRSETQSTSNSREERSCSHSRRRRASPNAGQAEENAHALLERGRSRRRSAEISLQLTAYVGGDRRGRGRTPPPGRRPPGSILL